MSATAAAAMFFAAALAATPEPDVAAYEKILRVVVRGERVDYAALQRDHLPVLTRWLDGLAPFDPAPLDRAGRLAFYINLYNATVLKAVSERYKPGYGVTENSWKLFDEPLVRFAGKTVSLNDLENKIVRPEFKDPRVHAALVCAAVSCPPLADKAYRGAGLDKALDARMRAFINDAKRNRVDVAAKRLELSEILKWYAADFGGEAALDDYVARWRAEKVAGFNVTFIPYDWKLNVIE